MGIKKLLAMFTSHTRDPIAFDFGISKPHGYNSLYQHTVTVVGLPAEREAYFRGLTQGNPDTEFIWLDGATPVAELDRLEKEMHARFDQTVGNRFFLTGNASFGRRVLVVNELPDAADLATNEFALWLMNIQRICRGAGYTVFYGVRDMSEFVERNWGYWDSSGHATGEALFNATCLTQIRVDTTGPIHLLDMVDLENQPFPTVAD